jgi:hypothetical protein
MDNTHGVRVVYSLEEFKEVVPYVIKCEEIELNFPVFAFYVIKD